MADRRAVPEHLDGHDFERGIWDFCRIHKRLLYRRYSQGHVHGVPRVGKHVLASTTETLSSNPFGRQTTSTRQRCQR